VFGLGSVVYWMDTTRFSSLCQTLFLPGNDTKMTSQVGTIYLNVQASLTDLLITSVTF